MTKEEDAAVKKRKKLESSPAPSKKEKALPEKSVKEKASTGPSKASDEKGTAEKSTVKPSASSEKLAGEKVRLKPVPEKSVTEPSSSKSDKATTYTVVSDYEEKRAKEADEQEDFQAYRTNCNTFYDLIMEIGELKSKKPEGWKALVAKKRTVCGMLTVGMKKLNRREKIRMRNTRDHISVVRQNVDVLQLKLQNVISEMQHLRKEIDKCMVFKYRELGVDLVSIDEFYEQAPKSISQPELTVNDEHQLQLARLEWELKQRKELSEMCNSLESSKRSLTSQIKKKVCDLDNLAPMIKDVLAVTQPIQDSLGMPASPVGIKNDDATFLPHPLYFLFIQTSAYQQACDNKMIVTICGNVDDAKKFKQSSEAVIFLDDSDSDSQEDDKSKKSRKTRGERSEDRIRALYEKFPLTVNLNIFSKDESTLEVIFSYLVKLKVVTVSCSFMSKHSYSSVCANHVFLSDSLLHNLFPCDNGMESPNLANYFQLKKAGANSFDTSKAGFPYIWAQRLAGLDFGVNCLPQKKIELDEELSRSQIPSVAKALHKRIKNRLSLASQLITIENGNSISGPSTIKTTCHLVSGIPQTWTEFRKHPASAHLKNSPYVSKQDLFFKALLSSGTVEMEALIALKPDYPNAPPVFAVSIEKDGTLFTASTSPQIFDIEREMNVYWSDFVTDMDWSNNLLTVLIQRLSICFDVFLMCQYPDEFGHNKKLFSLSHRGRTRAIPLKADPEKPGHLVQR